MTDAALLSELTRVKALFQLRAIFLHMGFPAPAIRQRDQQQAADDDAKFAGSFGEAGAVNVFHNQGGTRA